MSAGHLKPILTTTMTHTMESVAREARVATSTVSRALRGDRRIGASTRTRIRTIAEQLGYRPNPMVAVLMSQVRASNPAATTCNLAWLDASADPDAWRSFPVQRAFFLGASSRALEANYTLNRISMRTPGMTATRLAQILRSRGVRGILLPDYDGNAQGPAPIPAPLDEFTVVTVGACFQEPALHFASNDPYSSSRTAVLELWKLGYRRIGYIGQRNAELAADHRSYAGYHATLEIELRSPSLPPLFSAARDDLQGWLRHHQPDAVYSSDGGLLATVRALGWRVPEELGVAHLQVDAADQTTSGISHHGEAVGAAAVELLIGVLNKNERGVPRLPVGVLVPGAWVAGTTVRSRN